MININFFDWNPIKNEELLRTRGITFEEVELAIENGGVIDILIHPNKTKYPNQRIFVIKLNKYIYYVPFIEDETSYFLKTIYPSRNGTKKYLGERYEKEI